MEKRKVWLLIVLGILASVVAWALLGRNVWNATTAPVGSAAPLQRHKNARRMMSAGAILRT